jgi:hypothetical protein
VLTSLLNSIGFKVVLKLGFRVVLKLGLAQKGNSFTKTIEIHLLFKPTKNFQWYS